MYAKNLWHYDLHDDNVLVRNIAPDEGLDHRFEPKLIDFGSCKPKEPEVSEGGARGDYFYVAVYSLRSMERRSVLDGRVGRGLAIWNLGVEASAVGDGDEFVENRLVWYFQLQFPLQLAETTFARLLPALDLGDDVGECERL